MRAIKKKLLHSKKKWLITGVAGFIGSNLAHFLLENNQIVFGIDNIMSGKIQNLKVLKKYNNFTFFKIDLAKEFKLNLKVDYCVHLAALNSVPRSFDNPNQVSINNISSFINIINLANKIKIKKIVYASSSSVYGNLKNKFKNEKLPVNPISPYAISKVSNEYFANVYAKKKMKFIGIRFFNIYGYNQSDDKKYSAVIPSWIRTLKNENKIYVYGNSLREFCYIDDAIKAILLAIFKPIKNDHEILNVSGGNKISIKDLAIRFVKIFGNKHTSIKLKKKRIGDIIKARADLKKVKNLIGFKPTIDVDEGLNDIKKKLLQYGLLFK